jgi:hypothetical protein
MPAIDGWQVVSYDGDKHLPDGRVTLEVCGWVRDVTVERPKPPKPRAPSALPAPPPGPPEVDRTSAVLEMPCTTDATGKLVAAKPRLVLPPQWLKKPEPLATATGKVVPKAPLCKPGEKPKTKLAPGEVACVEPKARPCGPGEKPKPKERLAAGEMACEDLASDRGVPFLKGELSHLGDVQLVNARSSIGVGIGAVVLDDVYFAQLRPDLNVHYGQFKLGVGAPLRFEIADLSQADPTDPTSTKGIFGNLGRFRTEDWDQVEDFLRPLRYLTWGKKEDRLYIDVNRVHSITIGHGQLVRRYQGNIDIDEDNLFAVADGYTDFGGFELMAGPFPVPRLAGGLVFVKPLGLFLDDWMSKSFSIGGSWITDLNAPTQLDKRANPADGRPQLLVDDSNQFLWEGRSDPVGNVVQGVGVDSELKVVKTDAVDLKVYGDYSHLFFPADRGGAWDAFDGGGAAVGGLLRVSFGMTPVRPIENEAPEVREGKVPREMKAGHALRVRLEGRTFSPQYLPSYWNTLYEVDRLQFGQSVGEERADRAALPTKIGALALKADEPWRAGFYLEATYAMVDAVAFTALYEDAYPLGAAKLPTDARNFALHVESQGLDFLQLFASYHYRNFERFDGMFSFNTDNEVFFFGGRLQLLPILFINVAAQRAFRVGFEEDDAGQVDRDGNRFTSVGLENVWAGAFDVELGWQF